MNERIIDRVMFTKIQIKGMKIKIVDVAFVICLLVLSFMARWQLMPIESADYFGFLDDWMRQIKELGGFQSLAVPISNYTSPYMYIMCLLSYIGGNPLYLLKAVSILFDYIAAAAVFLIVYQLTSNVRKSILGMGILLLAPTVILDSAYWCQCDSIYTSFLLLAFYFMLKGNSRLTMIMVGVSFAFKLQALFFVPFLIIMWLKKKTIKLTDFLYIPLVYIISAIPAWMMGRKLTDLLFIYVNQSSYYPWGTLEYPNIYALLGESMPKMHSPNEISGAGVFVTLILLGGIAYYIYTSRIRLTNEFIVTLALFTTALTVYSLPHMHERYGYLVDLLAIVYGVIKTKRLPVTCGFILVSLMAYMPYLIVEEIIPIQHNAILLLGLITFVGYDLYHEVKAKAPKSNP